MLCRSSVELMSLRLDGVVDPVKHAELDHHLRTCVSCRHDWSLMQEADTLLRLSARTPLAPPAHFVASVMIRVAATPVARPILWERLRIEGGRRTAPLEPVRQRSTQPLRPTSPIPALGLLAPNAPAHTPVWLQTVLSGLGAATAVALLLVMIVGSALAGGGGPIAQLVSSPPAGPLVQSIADVGRTGTTAVWHLLGTWLGQIDPLVIGLGAIALAGCAALWLYLVESYLRRNNGERMQS